MKIIVVIVFFRVFFFLFLDQGQAVGDGNLVIVGMDFGKGQKAMAIAAILHERRLERGLHSGYFCQINIAFEGLARGALEIKLFNAVATCHHNAGFLALAGVDEHFAAHGL